MVARLMDARPRSFSTRTGYKKKRIKQVIDEGKSCLKQRSIFSMLLIGSSECIRPAMLSPGSSECIKSDSKSTGSSKCIKSDINICRCQSEVDVSSQTLGPQGRVNVSSLALSLVTCQLD